MNEQSRVTYNNTHDDVSVKIELTGESSGQLMMLLVRFLVNWEQSSDNNNQLAWDGDFNE